MNTKRVCVVVLLLAIVGGGVVYLDYHAYRLRFPDAPGWTYFFK